ncbi:hypothetical protein CMUS01_09629 [Colletotrichum musicola]|uniref:Peroxin-14 n=1 Tax=Colletotrichum musicola TaxID=2175873 RepID=A0A8H6NA79_9PEZI|nr:hypothetical protein CMUS01_09629 [Colletotrichum musicola]
MHISAALFLLSATGTLARPALDSSTWKAILDATNDNSGGNSVGGQQSANPTPGANPVGGQNWAKRDADPEDLLELLGPIAGLFPYLPDQKPDAPWQRDWKKKKSPHDHLFDVERRLDARDNQDAVNGQLPVSLPPPTDDGLTETAPEPQLQSRFLRPIMDSFRDAIEEAIRESRKNLPTSPKAEQTPDSSGGDVPSQTAPKNNPLTKAIPQLQGRSVPLNINLREIFKKLQEAIEKMKPPQQDKASASQLQSRSEVSDILKRLREAIEKMKPPQQDHASASKRDVSWQLAPGPIAPETKKSPPGSGDGLGKAHSSTGGPQQGPPPGNSQSKGGDGSPERNQGPPPNAGNQGPSCPAQKRDLDEKEIARAIVKEFLDAGYTAEDITHDLTVMPAPVEKREESDALGRWEKPFRGIREELLAEGYTHEEIDQMIGWTPSPSEGKDGIQW